MASQGPRVHLEIGSRFENIELVQIAVEASLRQLNLDVESSHSIGTAVREAVANAIRHGNAMDPDKKVEIDFGIEGEDVVIRVLDQGPGFDPEDLPDPTAPDNLLRPNGRGIFFMKEFMDQIDYSFEPGRGTQVTLRKRSSKPPSEARQGEEEQR
jgi:serine/threonine-protein kinase RsbW